MDFKILLCFAVLCLAAHATSNGALNADDSAVESATETKRWRIFEIKKTTTSSVRSTTKTKKRQTTTAKRGRKPRVKATSKRQGQSAATIPVKRSSTKIQRLGKLASGPTRKTSKTIKRMGTTKARANGRMTTIARRTMPPMIRRTTTKRTQQSKTTIKLRGVPVKLKQSKTTKRGTTAITTRRTPVTTETMLRTRFQPRDPLSFYGIVLYNAPPPPLPPTTTTTTEGTSNVNPRASNETTTENKATNATTSDAEYEDGDYEYPAEEVSTVRDSTTVSGTSSPTTELMIATNATSTATRNPNLIRKRRKKVTTSVSSTTSNPGVRRVRLRRKKTTIAPVQNVTKAANEVI
uniref:Salivary glue protein Sgs-3 n=1 Tax=Anopheles farauti TaxID=69004 RepID=A0A182QMX4_9DIPT